MNKKELKEKYGNECIGQVIRIVSPTELIINVGYNSNLDNNDSVDIYELGDDIKDIDGNTLGKYHNIKATLTVKSVEENFAICVSKVITKKSPLLQVSLGLQEIETQESLNVDQDAIEPLTFPTTRVIKIGDLVRKA
ncbi:hypothetical protein SAMN04487759_1421 [Kandleria vitulina]|uniref:Uncharacterized protein n=1 Tax=Kandleria vitulina TaxID=1630 RepID=A0A1H2VYI1_9FIRM|nr:hypothetical protein [Kandleria vitulina]SDW73428.1 hypothetical protein SAMN04487759_1421 [Kandleria vitulina]